MSNQDLEVYAAAAATCDGVYTRLRAQVELLREGADNIAVIKTLLDMTIPKDAPSCAIAGALQFLANGRDSGALLHGLFKDRRASLLLLMDGTAAAKALMAEDLISIHKTKEGYVVTRLTDALVARSSHVGHHVGHHVDRHEGRHNGRPFGRHEGRYESRQIRGDQHGRSEHSHQKNLRGGRGGTRGGNRSGDKVPYSMSPDMVKDIIDNAAKDLRAGAVEEFPLPTHQRATQSYSTALVQPTADKSESVIKTAVASAVGTVAETPAVVTVAETPAVGTVAETPAVGTVAETPAVTPAASTGTTPAVSIRVKKPAAARAARAAAAEPLVASVVTPAAASRRVESWGDDVDDGGKFFSEPPI